MVNNRCDAIQLKQARKIGPARRSVAGIYVFRGRTAIPYESTLERDFLIRQEFALDVREVISQPVRISFAIGGRSYVYTPDFLVYYRLDARFRPERVRSALIEVKPGREWRKHWREWLPKWKAARRYAKERGWAFRIQDESRIRDRALENIRFLERYKRMRFPPEESRRVVETVRDMAATSCRHLLSRHFPGFRREAGIACIRHLLATRRLDCDVGRPLDDFTELWVPNDE